MFRRTGVLSQPVRTLVTPGGAPVVPDDEVAPARGGGFILVAGEAEGMAPGLGIIGKRHGDPAGTRRFRALIPAVVDGDGDSHWSAARESRLDREDVSRRQRRQRKLVVQ